MSAPGIVSQPHPALDIDAPDFAQRLNPREWTIARALAEGQSLPAIAASQHVSIDGLTSEIAGIFRVLGVATLAHMLLLFAGMPELRAVETVYVEDLGPEYEDGAGRRLG